MTQSDNQTKDMHDNETESGFSSMKLLAVVLRNKYFIIGFAVIVTAVTAVYWFNQPNIYQATTNLVPPKTSGSSFEGMIGNISSTLRNFGLTKIGPKTDGSYSPSVILESRTVKDSMIKLFNLRELYDMKEAKADELRGAFDEHLDITVELDGNYTISILDTDPVRAAAMANKYVELANNTSKDIFQRESKLNRTYLEKRLSSTDSALKVTSDSLQNFSRIYKIYHPEEQALTVGQALIDLRSEIIKQEIQLELMKNRYGETDPLTAMQTEVISELKSKLNDAENLPGFSGNFSLNNATKVGIEYARLFAEYETFTKVKAFLMPMLEEQKINELRESISFIVLDIAIPPDQKHTPKRSLYIGGALLGSVFLGIMFVIFLYQFKEFRLKYKKAVNS